MSEMNVVNPRLGLAGPPRPARIRTTAGGEDAVSRQNDAYLSWLMGVGRQMGAARLMARALSDMRDIESYDRLKCDAALEAWESACADRATK